MSYELIDCTRTILNVLQIIFYVRNAVNYTNYGLEPRNPITLLVNVHQFKARPTRYGPENVYIVICFMSLHYYNITIIIISDLEPTSKFE